MSKIIFLNGCGSIGKAYVQHLKAHKVYYIGVFCDLAVMQEREVLRRDRCIGLSNDQIDRVHQCVLNSYDFKVDTTAISPFEGLVKKGDSKAVETVVTKILERHGGYLWDGFRSDAPADWKECDENKILDELKSREPIFHHPEKFGKTKEDIENQMCDEFWEAKDFELTTITLDNYLLTYILIQDKTRVTRRSTFLRKKNGDWKILYTCGTVIDGGSI